MNKIPNNLTFVEIVPDNIEYLAVMLHGYGADNLNMMPVARSLSRTLPNVHFVLPNGPFAFEGDVEGRQWFSLIDRSEKAMLEGANEAEGILRPFLVKQLNRFNLPCNKLIMMGFSQGAMMALHVGLRLPKKILGIVSYSGAIISWQNGILSSIEQKGYGINNEPIAKPGDNRQMNSNKKPHILLVHGNDDTVVQAVDSQTAHRKFLEVGLDSSLYTEPSLGHCISNNGILKASLFLDKIIEQDQ